MEIKFTQRTELKTKPTDTSKLGFGKYFSDYMFIMEHNAEKGWHNARIVPFDYLPIHPASTVLHYGLEIFEGLKAYKTAQGNVQLFRPIENIRRMNNSAAKFCMPALDEEDTLEILKKFVDIEKDWVPAEEGTSFYLRPFMFGNDESLGVHAAKNTTFVLIGSPSGAYYAEGIKPVKIAIESHEVRAVRGGTGFTKCGGNYAASVHAGEMASKKGFAQVLWLDGVHQKYIEEVGAMNVMFKINGEIITPSLDAGTVLPGITRKSCLELLRDWGYKVTERLISVDELKKACEDGTLEEAWGTGTAAVVSPVGQLTYDDVDFIVNNGQIGELTQKLYDELTGIQWGKRPDTKNWIVKVN